MKTFLGIFLFIAVAASANPKECASPKHWAARIAEQRLIEIGKLKKDLIDRAQTKVTLLASEAVKKDLFHQVQKIEFHEKGGNSVTVITQNDATLEECSGGDVTIYITEKILKP